MRKIYYVTTSGPWDDAQSSKLASYLNEKLPDHREVSTQLSRLVEAEVILKYTFLWYKKRERQWHELLIEAAEQIPEDLVPPGYDEAWCADNPEARGALMKVEILVPALLNHFYIVHQHLLGLTRELCCCHGVALVPSMSPEKWESKKWQRHLSRALQDECVQAHATINYENYIKLLMVRRIRVHEESLYAHLVTNSSSDSEFTWQGQVWEEQAHVSLTGTEISKGLEEFQLFLRWYIDRIQTLLGPRKAQ